MSQVIIYGIKNCDTMQKAFRWLDQQGIAYHFHNYKTDGLSKEIISGWLTYYSLSELINSKGTTYRNLSESEKASLGDQKKAISLMISNPSLIKRPLLSYSKGMLKGFEEEKWESVLG